MHRLLTNLRGYLAEDTLASGAKDRTVQIWNALKREPVATLKGHSRTVNAIVWRKQTDGPEVIASASRDCMIRIWEPFSEKEYDTTVPSHNDAVTGIEISPDGLLVATRSKDKTVKVWKSGSGEILHSFQKHTDWISALVFSPNSQMLASGGYDQHVILYHVDGDIIADMTGHLKTIIGLRFSPDNQILASYADDCTIKVWNLKGEALYTSETHTRRINALKFSPDCGRLVSGSYDSNVVIHSIRTRSIEFVLKGHIRSIDAICFSPNGNLIASGSKDQTVKIWNAVDGKLIITLRSHDGPVATLFFSSDNRYLISRAGEEVKIWDSASGGLLNTQKPVLPFTLDSATATTWLPSGCIYVKQVAPGQSENEMDYRYVKKAVRLLVPAPSGGVESIPTLQFQADSRASGDSHQDMENHFACSPNLQWITCDGKNMLFLPGHLRPRIFAIHGQNVILGNGSGRVLMHGFDHSRL